jgi:hypothetical protein
LGNTPVFLEVRFGVRRYHMNELRSSSVAIFLGLWVTLFLAFGAGKSYCTTLQSMYNTAGPGEGYDKLVILERGEVYIGPLTISGGVRCCIRGNDAVCSLANSNIFISAGSTLDISDCVLYGGHYALHYSANSNGTIRGNTIYGGVDGIRAVLAQVTIENNIIAQNSGMGIAIDEEMLPFIQYNDVWENLGGNYMAFCSG